MPPEELKWYTERNTILFGLRMLMTIQARNAGALPDHLRDYDDADFRTAALGAFVELGELVNECQWKPWRAYDPPTPEGKQRAVKEFADVLHMLAWIGNNLNERLGITGLDLAEGFMAVAAENRARFEGRVPGREPPAPRWPRTGTEDNSGMTEEERVDYSLRLSGMVAKNAAEAVDRISRLPWRVPRPLKQEGDGDE